MRSHRSVALAAAALLIVGAGIIPQPATAAPDDAQGQSAARIAEIMHRLREVQRFGAVAVAPDGRTVAWTIEEKPKEKGGPAAASSRKHGRDATPGSEANDGKPGQILQLANADGTQVRTVTIADAAKSCNYSDLAWSPASRTLAFLSNCNHTRKSDEQLDIYEVGPEAGVARRMTHLQGFVHELTWTPNGSQLSFLFVKGDTRPISAVSATKPQIGVIGETGVERQGVALVAASGGEARQITPTSVFVYEYDWSPKGDRLAYVGAPPPGRDNWWVAKLYTQTPGGTPKVTLDPSSVKGPLHGLQIALPRWSPDGSQIAVIGGLMSDQGSTGGDIYLVPARGGGVVNVTPGIGISPSWLTWTGNQTLLVSSIAAGATRLSVFALHGNSPATERPLFTADSGIEDGTFESAVSVSSGHSLLAFIESTFDSPPEVYSAGLATSAAGEPMGVTGAPHAITHINDAVKPMWGKAVAVRWSNEGFQVQGWLLFPTSFNPLKRYPMIVYVHGGPSSATRPGWPRDGYGPVPLAAMGYFVLMPNPRGSYGEGERFTQGVRLNMGYGDLRDILAGVDRVEASYPIDDNRLGLTGWSYGGFMSMFAPTQTHRFKAAVVGAGLSDWESYYGENSIDEWMIPFFGASVYQAPQAYAKSSAINFIDKDKTPSLVVVGEYDGECPAPQSFEYWHALHAMGVPTQLVVYAGEGHGFHVPKDTRDVMERALHWFAQYLGTSQEGAS